MTEVLWSAVLATLIFLPILFRSLFSPLSFKRTQNDSVSVSPSIRYSPVKWHKIPNCSVFHCLWKLFVRMLREKRDDCLQCAVIRGWHADNRFCCGVIAARWGVSLPGGGPRARRRRLVPLSTRIRHQVAGAACRRQGAVLSHGYRHVAVFVLCGQTRTQTVLAGVQEVDDGRLITLFQLMF